MKVVKIKLSELKKPKRNVRMHSDKQIEEFKRSVKMFGQIRPIVVDENNVMLAGNGLYETLVALEYTEADCYVVKGLSENEKKKLMLADNRIFNLGVDDLAAFDEVIKELDGDFDIPGYDDDLLETLIADSEDVDEMMSDYGTVTEEKKEEIRSNAAIYV
ncbi:MAG: ParB/Srx family N-terminal domain-containing protein, partial [Acutalibacteraceae bacterium]